MRRMKKIILKIIYRILRDSAKRAIDRNNPKIIAITGTVGKTSAKEAIFAVMRKKYQNEVSAASGNLNTEIGVPLTVLGYKKQPTNLSWPINLLSIFIKSFFYQCPRHLILELAVDKPGDMDYFGEFIRLDVAVITAITPVHLANFSDFKQLRDEKCKIIKLLKSNGHVVINADDESISCDQGKNVIGYSIKQNAEVCASDIKLSESGNEYKLEIDGDNREIRSKLFGYQTIYAQLAGASVGSIFNIKSDQIVEALENQKSLPGRMNILEGKNDITIIDDSYNASPASVKAALDALSDVKHSGRKVAILGNMNELGSIEKDVHREVAKYALAKVDFAIFVGQNAKSMFEEFGDSDHSAAFDSRIEAEHAMKKLLREGDLVLVKASQNGNYFEEIVKKLMKNPEESDKVLVRQSRYWLKKKNIH
jgi:UDP-N-acetylmuramoyl-tripeptide--D-alanyl-D-alanine ligase